MTRRVIELAEGLVASADQRLSPDGLEIDRHYIRVACRLAEAESKLATLDLPVGAFDLSSQRTRESDANYSVLEAAHACWTLAVRLRARATGAHARRAGEPLLGGLLTLAGAIPVDTEVVALDVLRDAAQTLVRIAPVIEVAHVRDPSTALTGALERSAQQLVAVAVLGLLRLAAELQDGGDAA